VGDNVYSFKNLTKGDYTAVASADDYLEQTVRITVSGCGPHESTITLLRKPRLIVEGVFDETGSALTRPVRVVVNDMGKHPVARDTWKPGSTTEFVLTPGAFEVRLDEPPGELRQIRPAFANLEPNTNTPVRLHVGKKPPFDFIIEVRDAPSKQLINPPVGLAVSPHVDLEPKEGQPRPTATYQGGGEIAAYPVRVGRYTYTANFSGWKFQTGSLEISVAEAAQGRVTKVLWMEPEEKETSLSFVVTEWGNWKRSIFDYKVSLKGLGPPKGYSYETRETVVPGQPENSILYGAFMIPARLLSGHYLLVVTHPCYEPYQLDTWWAFGPGAITLDNGIEMEPTKTTLEARQARQDLLDKATDKRRHIDSLAAALENGQTIIDRVNKEADYIAGRVDSN
jgi:hypothetical protein